MPDFNVRSDTVNVEQIMEQIRSRIREKRGVDYTEAQVQELASVKLEKFLDPRGVRSDLLEQFRRAQPPYAPPELPNFSFEAETLFESTRGPIRWIRKLLLPVLKLFFNPNPLIQALNIQSKLNASVAQRESSRDATRHAFDQLHYEVMHNLVLETTRLGIEVKNLKMRLESLSSRLDFNERRARALEGAVVYKPATEERPARHEDGNGRREEPRREDARRDEPRRQEPRRNEQQTRQQPPPRAERPERPARTERPERVERQDRTERVEAVDAVAAESAAPVGGDAPSPAPAVEGPGQKSRRRRRRRGRRGSGAAAALMEGGQPGPDPSDEDQTTDAVSGTEADTGIAPVSKAEPLKDNGGESTPPERVLEVEADSRTARPEPFEHTFGAGAHPSERTMSDPGQVTATPLRESNQTGAPAQPPAASDTSTAPEQ